MPVIGWRVLFALGVLPAFFALGFIVWVPESPLWLLTQGGIDDARNSLAWALERDPAQLGDLEHEPRIGHVRFVEIFDHPRSLLASWLSQLGFQTGANGVALWAPTLLVLVLDIPVAQAARLMIGVTVAGLAGRLIFVWASEFIGRRPLGLISALGAAAALTVGAILHSEMIGSISLFWVCLMLWAIFGDGGYAVVGPYAAEVWPARIRTTG